MVCTLEHDSFDAIISSFSADKYDFNDYCHYCLKKIAGDSRYYALKHSECSEPEIVHICKDCYENSRHEQKIIAIKLLKEFFNEHELEILDDYSDYSDDPSTAQYDNYFFINKFSDLLISAPDYIFVASNIAGQIQVGHRKNDH